MDNKNRVIVLSHQKGELILRSVEHRFTRSFPNAGSQHKIDFDILEDMVMNDPGIQYMLAQGMISIPDKEDRVALGLEEDDTTLIKIYTRDEMTKLLIGAPISDFKTTIDKASTEQRRQFAELAVELKIKDTEKATYLKAKTGIDVLKRLALKEEPVA